MCTIRLYGITNGIPFRTIESTVRIKTLFHHPSLHHHHSDICKNSKNSQVRTCAHRDKLKTKTKLQITERY